MKFIKQNKARDHYKMNLYRSEKVYVSEKMDGIYLQIHKKGDSVKCYLSSGKELVYPGLEKMLEKLPDIILECEVVCYTDNRTSKSRSSMDAMIKKAIRGDSTDLNTFGTMWVFDVINEDLFSDRIELLKQISSHVNVVDFTLLGSDVVVALMNRRVETENIEGLMLKKPRHRNIEGKRSNDAIKLKPINTADLTIVGREGDYISLVDSNGIYAKVKVNSVLMDFCKVGRMVEIAFDFIGKKYNQARFLDFRTDKEMIA